MTPVNHNLRIEPTGILLSHKEENMAFADKWVELEIMMLSEIRQSQKPKDWRFTGLEWGWGEWKGGAVGMGKTVE